MRFITTKLLTLCALFCMALGAVAQTTPLPYKNGFEVDAENLQWHFVGNDASATNKWVVGQAVKQAGLKSLYVSPDGDAKGYNDNTAQIVTMAYRSFDLPAGGTYSFFMDYRHQGVSSSDSLFVCWVDDPTIAIPTTTGGALPSWVRAKAKVVDQALYSNQRNLSFSVCGGAGRLVIVWKKGNASPTNTIKNNEIYIDNIQINKNLDYTYFTGFDDNEETAGWTLYSDYSNTNKWIYGNAINLTNSRSLYVSHNGKDYTYDGTKPGIVSAVKEFTLPAGEYYNIEFDYLVGGDNQDYMYVVWVDNVLDTTFDGWNTNASSFIDPIIQNSAKPTPNFKYKSTPTWTHAAFQVEGKGYPVKLAFVWINNNQKATTPSAVVDNLSIKKGIKNVGGAVILPAECATPNITEVLSTGGGLKITWDDDHTSTYELAYRNTYDTIGGLFQTVMGVRSPYSLEGLQKGAYTVFLRKFCPNSRQLCGVTLNDTSAWAVNTQNVVLTGDGCINYGDLKNTQTVTCTYGTWDGTATNQAFQNIGIQTGRHTLVTKPTYDPRTIDPANDNPGLFTIPYGELASVKLGNEDTGSQCEGLIYNLHVDPSYVLLVMRYAVVLEDPDHPQAQQPRFKLELLNSAGTVINPDCGSLNFISGYSTTGWHKVGSVWWKEWSTIGLNLEDYANQDIKIRVSTWDCSQGAHFGYAYFMLDCASKQFEGFSCSSETIDTIYAPEGFAYCWYKKYKPDGTLAYREDASLSEINCISNERGFAPTSIADTATYVCKVMLKTEQGIQDQCYFNISAQLAPRLPEAKNAYKSVPKNCINYVQLSDSSVVHVGTATSGVVEQPTGRKWIIRENNERGRVFAVKYEKDPLIEFPSEGGTYHVTLISILDGTGLCNDTIKFSMNVPRIGTVTKNQKVTTCRENVPYTWRGKRLSTDGVYRDTVLIQATGCDSIFVLDFKVADKIEIEERDTICDGDVKNWEGEALSTTGTYTKTYPSQVGCDSTMIMHLQVNPVMRMSVKPFGNPICADDPNFTMHYANAGGSEPTKYTLTFKSGSAFAQSDGEYTPDAANQIVVPIPVDIRPDKYTVNIKFEDNKYGCPGTTLDIPFVVDYKSATIEQNWNDVIAVLNNKYNGGYSLNKYQWYKNGEPIAGETKSYLYVSSGLEVGAKYNVELTRVGEDYAIFTCPIEAKPYTANATPSIVGGASPVRVYDISEGANVYIYSVTGMLVSQQRITPDSPEYIAPQASGIYIVKFVMDSGITRNMKIVVAQ